MNIFFSRMNEARHYAAGAHHKDLGFLVAGGWNGPHGPHEYHGVSTTEITTDGVTFDMFTQLPIALSSPCMVALDGEDGEFFIAGGSSSSGFSRRAFIHRDNQWDEVEQMETARYGKMSNLEMQGEMN